MKEITIGVGEDLADAIAFTCIGQTDEACNIASKTALLKDGTMFEVDADGHIVQNKREEDMTND